MPSRGDVGRGSRPLLGIAIASACAACAELPPAGTCGNGVVELALGEDCDRDAAGCSDACRFACLDDDSCTEPGYVCGADRVCRLAAGLVYAAATARLDTELVGIADVDGDAIGDVLGASNGTLDVLYGAPVGAAPDRTLRAGLPERDSGGGPVAAIPIRPGEVALAAPQLGVVGLVVASGDAVSAPTIPQLDLGGRELGAAAIATPVILVLSRTASDPAATIEVVANGALVEQASACGPPTPLEADAFLRSKRIGAWPTQALVHPGGSTYCLRSYGPGGPLGSPEAIPIPPGLENAWPAQLDGDRCVEVVLDLPGFQVGIADASESNGCVHTTVEPAFWIGGDRVIGVGDFDGDARDEVITSSFDGTLVASPTFETQVRRELDAAVAADVNRDGRVDFVGGAAGAVDLTVLLALADGTYAPHRVTTQFPVSRLATADVDADTFPDVFTATPALGSTGARLHVHYGSPIGLLAGQLVATIGDARGVAVGDVFGADAFADLVVAHGAAAGGAAPMLSLFAGSAKRSPYAPIITDTPEQLAVAGGPVVAGSGPLPDLVAIGRADLATAQGLASWWLGDLAGLRRRDLDPSILDAEPFTTLVAVGLDAARPTVFVVRRESTGDAVPVDLLVIRAEQTSDLAVTSALEPGIIPLPAGARHEPRHLRAVELDGDELAELVVALDEFDAAGMRRRRLFVVDRGPAARPAVDVAALVGATTCYDGDAIQLGADPARRTLVVACAGTATGDGLFVIGDAADPTSIAHVAELALEHAVVLAGDVNGDAIEDIAVRSGTTGFGVVHLVMQCSTSTAESCPAQPR